jgi:hypothetical protein
MITRGEWLDGAALAPMPATDEGDGHPTEPALGGYNAKRMVNQIVRRLAFGA